MIYTAGGNSNEVNKKCNELNDIDYIVVWCPKCQKICQEIPYSKNIWNSLEMKLNNYDTKC